MLNYCFVNMVDEVDIKLTWPWIGSSSYVCGKCEKMGGAAVFF